MQSIQFQFIIVLGSIHVHTRYTLHIPPCMSENDSLHCECQIYVCIRTVYASQQYDEHSRIESQSTNVHRYVYYFTYMVNTRSIRCDIAYDNRPLATSDKTKTIFRATIQNHKPWFRRCAVVLWTNRHLVCCGFIQVTIRKPITWREK